MKPVFILIVDDNQLDSRFINKALLSIGVEKTVAALNDGEEALNFIRKQGKFTDVKKPDVMILDLKMPKKNGIELLEELERDGLLAGISTVVVTTSEDGRDRKRCTELGAKKFITKPMDLDKFEDNIKSIAPMLEEISREKPDGE